MKRKLLYGLLALGALAAAAPAVSAQEVRLTLARGGLEASFASGRGLGLRYGHTVCPSPGPAPVRHVGRSYQVWVPATTERVWQEPLYEFRRDSCGNTYRVLVRPGGWCVIEHPGHFEWRSQPPRRPAYGRVRGY